MISVLCPTRLRLKTLEHSLESLRSRSDTDLEVLLAVDLDDPTDYFGVADFCWTGERAGYANLHTYYNDLIGFAHGDWLLLWNDDALMATDHWDSIVHGYEPNVVLSPDTIHAPLCTFPIVPRRFVEAIGHFSLNAHCDSWWEEIARELDILVWPPIRVEHDRADVTGNNADSVFQERRYQTAAFNAMRSVRLGDAEKIRKVL